MNKLTLTQNLSREAGVNQTGPNTTLNQTGEYRRLVSWIDRAYKAIQLVHSTWFFLRKEFVLPLAIGDANYTYLDASISSFAE